MSRDEFPSRFPRPTHVCQHNILPASTGRWPGRRDEEALAVGSFHPREQAGLGLDKLLQRIAPARERLVRVGVRVS